MLIPIFPMMLAVIAGSPIVSFVIVAVLVAVALYYIPRMITLDAAVWQIIRVVVLIALILWGLQIFGII